MSVPFLDLDAGYRELREEIDAAVLRVLGSGRYILGAEVEGFEAEWASYCGSPHAVGVASGLDAIEIALRALGIGEGCEVIVPSNTYIATWLGVSAAGATIVPVEPVEDTALLEAPAVEAAITSRTAAVLMVHLYGRMVDWRPLRALCDRHGLALLEDAAQAHGARRDDERAGAVSDAGCFSFYPSKNLGAVGDAGAITTPRADVAERARTLRNYGSRIRYFNEARGLNSRLDALQAAILRAKLPHLDEHNERRRLLASRYDAALADVPGLALPPPSSAEDQVHHLYVVRSQHRDLLRTTLSKAGVGTEIHYPQPPHRSGAYADLGLSSGAFPVAERLADEVLSLPMGPHLPSSAVEETAAILRASSSSL